MDVEAFDWYIILHLCFLLRIPVRYFVLVTLRDLQPEESEESTVGKCWEVKMQGCLSFRTQFNACEASNDLIICRNLLRRSR